VKDSEGWRDWVQTTEGEGVKGKNRERNRPRVSSRRDGGGSGGGDMKGMVVGRKKSYYPISKSHQKECTSMVWDMLTPRRRSNDGYDQA